MTIVTWVKCPKCENEFYFSAELERYNFKAACPFCKTSFKVEEAKLVIRSSPVISIK